MTQLQYKNVKLIDSSDFDELVEAIYNIPYCFQQQDGCIDRGFYPIEVIEDEEWLDDDYLKSPKESFYLDCDIFGVDFQSWKNFKASDFKHFQDWKSQLIFHRHFYPKTEILLHDLCKRGVIEAGKYYIEVDW